MIGIKGTFFKKCPTQGGRVAKVKKRQCVGKAGQGSNPAGSLGAKVQEEQPCSA